MPSVAFNFFEHNFLQCACHVFHQIPPNCDSPNTYVCLMYLCSNVCERAKAFMCPDYSVLILNNHRRLGALATAFALQIP